MTLREVNTYIQDGLTTAILLLFAIEAVARIGANVWEAIRRAWGEGGK
jgi:hypothetical protein